MPRKSSTNTRVLSARIDNIKKETNPVITVTPIRTNPPAKAVSTDRWRTQAVRAVKAGTGAVTLTVGAVVQGLGFTPATSIGSTSQFKILGIKVWNMTSAGTSSGYLSVGTGSILTISGITQSGEDFGNATSSPGMKLNIPDTLAANIALDPDSTGTIATANGTPTGLTGTASQTFCFDVTVMFRI